MTRPQLLLERILRGTSDASISFDDLRNLLRRLGFEERSRGSHFIFRRADIDERINLQSDGKHAKVYQVRQVRAVILRYRLGGTLYCIVTRSSSSGVPRTRSSWRRFPNFRAAQPMASPRHELSPKRSRPFLSG